MTALKHIMSTNTHGAWKEALKGFKGAISRILSGPQSGRGDHLSERPNPEPSPHKCWQWTSSPEVPYLVLHPMGFTVPLGSLRERWALTPPFHPYPPKKGGLFSAALAVKASSQTPCPRVSNPEDPLRGIVPCGVRTFLYWQNQQRSPAPLKPVGE